MPSLTATPNLLLEGVRRSFVEGGTRREVLRGIELDVASGESIALLGRSGSGKSTLLHVIAGLETIDAGRVTVAGTEMGTLDETARAAFRRRHLGFVFQSFHLLPTLTVRENVLLPLELDRRLRREDQHRADALLERVGLGDRANGFPDLLSGGEQQRIAIARALVAEPALLLADEPTGNLDAGTADQILDLIDSVRRERECTIVMATHSRSAAARCDRTLEIRDGAIAAP